MVDERTHCFLGQIGLDDLGDNDDVVSCGHALFDRGHGLPHDAVEERDAEGRFSTWSRQEILEMGKRLGLRG